MTMTLLRRSLFNLRMLLAVALSAAILIYALASMGYLRPEMFFAETGTDILSMYTIPFATSSFVIFAGIFPGLPYAYSYLEERNCGYLKFIQTRMPGKTYAAQKIFFTGLSGGMTMLIPAVIVFILLDMISQDTTPELYLSVMETKIWGPYMFIWGGRFVLFLKAILMFLFGVMWSELALLISLIVRNKYVALVLPFLFYEACWLLIPAQATVFNPVFLVRSDFDLPMPIWQPFLTDIVYIAILTAATGLLFRKRGKQ